MTVIGDVVAHLKPQTIHRFVILFTVYFNFMYSRCDLSTGIFYTNIWIWIWMDL